MFSSTPLDIQMNREEETQKPIHHFKFSHSTIESMLFGVNTPVISAKFLDKIFLVLVFFTYHVNVDLFPVPFSHFNSQVFIKICFNLCVSFNFVIFLHFCVNF